MNLSGRATGLCTFELDLLKKKLIFRLTIRANKHMLFFIIPRVNVSLFKFSLEQKLTNGFL